MYVSLLPNIKLQLLAFFTALLFSTPVLANPIIPVPTRPQPLSYAPGAPNTQGTGFILMDATSGKILAEKNSNERVPPASLTKLMSLYIISDAIKNGQVKLDDKVHISVKAWKTEGSRMFVKAGDEVSVSDLLQGIIVASGNDAAVAMAEHIAGTEEAFTAMMNQQAKLLGMNNSHFTDSTGLPDPDHYSTAHDLAILTQAYIKNFPEEYSHYSEKWFAYNGIKQPNRNRLLWRYQYADGLKTGHTNEAGYCLVASAKKDGMRLISVVLGEPNDAARTEDSIRLLNYGFRFFETRKLYAAKTPVLHSRVWQGENIETPLGVQDDMYVTVPTGQYKKLVASLTITHPLKAPIIKGQPYGTVNIILNDQVVAKKSLIALENNPRGNLWRRASDTIRYNLNKYFSKTEEKANTG
ncbi:MAG: D-alanyl-D-alanine carboxypeptidase [Gammaproteobacteria bacterium]|nr:D-alanyl-D-alanine carboxypeptidase [Gammaproteobacteria bacterium]MCW5584051.1 D-alanyl-D-alanine carboxypeptidase [Gammaproteobacteria bacterium]